MVVDRLSLDRWDDWTRRLLGPGKYLWPTYANNELAFQLRPAVHAILWPDDTKSLEIASKLLVDAIIALSSAFTSHSGYDPKVPGDYLVCDSIAMMLSEYRKNDRVKRTACENELHELQLKQWDRTLEVGVMHLAKCANWFADAVREHLNPRFRLTQGAFILAYQEHVSPNFGVLSFTEDETRRILHHGYHLDSYDVWSLVDYTWENPISAIEPTPSIDDLES